MLSNSVCNHARDKQIGLPLRGRPILLSLVWLQAELDKTKSYYHYISRTSESLSKWGCSTVIGQAFDGYNYPSKSLGKCWKLFWATLICLLHVTYLKNIKATSWSTRKLSIIIVYERAYMFNLERFVFLQYSRKFMFSSG